VHFIKKLIVDSFALLVVKIQLNKGDFVTRTLLLHLVFYRTKPIHGI
jgi:hypothetical protein